MYNLEDLLKKIGTTGIGESLKYAPEYQELFEDKKTQEESLLPKGVWETSVEIPKFEELEVRAWKLLTTKTKDLKLYGLWGEMIIKIDGWRGVNNAIEGFAKLLEEFKTNLYPKDAEEQSNVIDYIDRNWSRALLHAKLDAGLSIDYFGDILTWNKYIQERTNEDELKKLDFKTQDNFEKLKILGKEVKQNINELNLKLKELNLPQLKEVEQKINDWINFLKAQEVEEKTKVNTEENGNETNENENAEEETKNSEENAIKNGTGNWLNKAETRKEIFQQLENIITYFEEHEPHNMSIPLLYKALQWRDLSVPEILSQFSTPEELGVVMKILKP